MKDAVNLLLAAAVIVVAASTPSYAYLDPGTASVVVQSLVAAVAAGAATTGIFWQRVKSLFSDLKRKRKASGND
jgi:hypothetical protein